MSPVPDQCKIFLSPAFIVGGQKTDDRRQRAENRGQRTELLIPRMKLQVAGTVNPHLYGMNGRNPIKIKCTTIPSIVVQGCFRASYR